MRAIDADALQNEYKQSHEGKRLLLIDVAPTIEPERKTGTWYEHYSHEDGERDGVRCSECGTHYYFGGQLMNFCPNCGAYMREGEANDNGDYGC